MSKDETTVGSINFGYNVPILERVHIGPPILTEDDVRRIVREELRAFEQSHYKLFIVLRDAP